MVHNYIITTNRQFTALSASETSSVTSRQNWLGVLHYRVGWECYTTVLVGSATLPCTLTLNIALNTNVHSFIHQHLSVKNIAKWM